MIAALEDIASIMPFPVLGVDSDNGSEFINHHLLDWTCVPPDLAIEIGVSIRQHPTVLPVFGRRYHREIAPVWRAGSP